MHLAFMPSRVDPSFRDTAGYRHSGRAGQINLGPPGDDGELPFTVEVERSGKEEAAEPAAFNSDVRHLSRARR